MSIVSNFINYNTVSLITGSTYMDPKDKSVIMRLYCRYMYKKKAIVICFCFGTVFQIFKSVIYMHKDNMSMNCILHYTPLFFLKKMGCTGVLIFLIFGSKHRLWLLIRQPTICDLSNGTKIIEIFQMKSFNFCSLRMFAANEKVFKLFFLTTLF